MAITKSIHAVDCNGKGTGLHCFLSDASKNDVMFSICQHRDIDFLPNGISPVLALHTATLQWLQGGRDQITLCSLGRR